MILHPYLIFNKMPNQTTANCSRINILQYVYYTTEKKIYLNKRVTIKLFNKSEEITRLIQ